MTHTRNLCSAFNPSKCVHTHAHTHTHTEQWAANAVAPGEQLGVPCSRVSPQLWYRRWRERCCSPPHQQFLQDLRFEPTTSDYRSRSLSIRPQLPHKGNSGTRTGVKKQVQNLDDRQTDDRQTDRQTCIQLYCLFLINIFICIILHSNIWRN